MAIPDLPGYEKLAPREDTARRVLTPSGNLISRREYENRRFRAAGWESWRDFQQRRGDDSYMRFSRGAAEEQRLPLKKIRGSDSEFNKKYLEARKVGFGKSKSPTGKFGKLLVYTGDRKPSDKHKIGESPPRKRRRR